MHRTIHWDDVAIGRFDIKPSEAMVESIRLHNTYTETRYCVVQGDFTKGQMTEGLWDVLYDETYLMGYIEAHLYCIFAMDWSRLRVILRNVKTSVSERFHSCP